jgi:hypothetical protein
MSIDKTKLINVLNYNMNPIAIQTHVKEYLCASAKGENLPSVTPLSISEIEYMGSKDNVFKIGLLRFPEELEKEIYEEYLRMTDWKEILTNEEIKEIILHPTIDGLSKIINIKNTAYFERVRGIFFMLKNSNGYDISNRVEAVITRRYKELSNQQVKTDIKLTTKDEKQQNVSKEEINSLKEQNRTMQEQMETMQKMMEQMMAMQSNNVVSINETVTEETVKTDTKATSKIDNKKSTKK